MRSMSMVLGAVLMVALVTGCGPGLKAPQLADGGKIQVLALVDRGLTDTTADDQAKSVNQVTDWMEADLAKMFTKNGYDFQKIATADEYADAANRFLLKIKVLSYNPGNKGARVAGALVGGWSGAAMAQAAEARLAASYELANADGALVTGNMNEGSGTGDWNVAVRKVNSLIIKGVAKKIQGLYAK